MIKLGSLIIFRLGLPNGSFGGTYCRPSFDYTLDLNLISALPKHQASPATTIHIILIKYDSFMDRK